MFVGSGYVRVAGTSEIPVGKMKAVEVEGNDILIANVNGNYYAINNKCGHAGGNLSQGVLDGNVVTCPNHHAKLDVTTGKLVSKPKIGFLHVNAKDESTYQVKVENENIMVKI